MWSDLFLASGAVINLNNGDVTITHSANTLTFAGATTYAFDVAPSVGGSAVLLTSAIGSTVQAYDADLTTWAGLTPSANAQSLVTAADYAAMRALLDLEAGTDFYSIAAADAAFQPKDADLTSWALITRASGFDTFATTPSSSNLKSLVTDETGSGALVFGTDPTIVGGTHTALTGLGIRSTGAAFDLTLATSEVLSAGRTLSIVMGDAARTLTLGGNPTLNGGTHSGTNTGDQTITLTGDVTGSGTGSFAATIASDAVTNAKLANMATATFKGRTTGGTGDPEDLTATQATALLNVMVGDSGSGGTKGLVPAPAAGDAGKFLRGDGTYVAAGGGDALTTNPLSQFAATTSAQLAGVISDETGSGALVFATSPGFTTAANPVSNDGAALGTTALRWSDLFLASGAVINFNNDTTITHSAGRLTFADAEDGWHFDATGLEPAIIMKRLDNHGAAQQIGGWLTKGKNASNAEVYYSKIYGYAGDVTAGAEYGGIFFSTMVGGSFVNRAGFYNNLFYPTADDTVSLGASGLGWSDLFLSSGAVVNFAAGDTTLTHSSRTMTFGNSKVVVTPNANTTGNTSSTYALRVTAAAGGDFLTLGYDGSLPRIQSWGGLELLMNYEGNAVAFGSGGAVPATSDGAALGTTSRMWSDLFLASGSVINFNAGDVLIGHSSNRLDFSGASVYAFGYSGGAAPILLTERSDAHGNAVIGTFSAYGRDSAANSQLFGSWYWFVDDNTSGGEDASFYVEPTIAGASSVRAQFGLTVTFPSLSTTASGATAYLDTNNRLYRSTSSEKYKTDIETLTPEYADHIDLMRPVWYRSTAEADNKQWSWYGLIAEEVAAIDPRLAHWGYQDDQYDEVITENEQGDKRRTRVLKPNQEMRPDSVMYDRLTVLLLDKVQRLQARIEALEGVKQ